MIIFGNRLFGKVDRVPSLGFVATRFFHIDYLPLIPSQTWLVFQQTGKSWRGVRVPFSAKSILVAWARTASVIGGVCGIIGIIVFVAGQRRSNPADIASLALLTFVSCGVFAFTKLHKSCTVASYARACELGKLAKLNDKGMAALAAAYGQPPIRYGFEPVLGETPILSADPVDDATAVEEIPLAELEGQPADSEQTDNPASTPPSQLPLTETRRHG